MPVIPASLIISIISLGDRSSNFPLGFTDSCNSFLPSDSITQFTIRPVGIAMGVMLLPYQIQMSVQVLETKACSSPIFVNLYVSPTLTSGSHGAPVC